MPKSNFIKEIIEDKFIKNSFLVFGGSTIAQGIGIIVSPIISRIYSPREFGIMATFTAIFSILSITTSLDFNNAIPIAETDDSALNISSLSFYILIFYVSILCLILIVLNTQNIKFEYLNSLGNYIYILPIVILFFGLTNIFVQWIYRYRMYASISKGRVSQSILVNTLKITLGIFGLGSLGLLMSEVASQFILIDRKSVV